MRCNFIVAFCKKFGIGKNGSIPWHIPEDLKHFETLTRGHMVVIGRKTWESIPEKNRPLKNRLNIVLTTQKQKYVHLESERLKFCDRDEFEVQYSQHSRYDDIFFIGGLQVWNYALWRYYKIRIYVTQIDHLFECDVHFDKILASDWNQKIIHHSPWLSHYVDYDNLIRFRYITYDYRRVQNDESDEADNADDDVLGYIVNNPHPEYQYLKLLRRIIRIGDGRQDRTGTGTKALFAQSLRFDIKDSIPMITTKFISWKTVIEELLWFLRGGTSSKDLESKGVTIWRANSTSDFLKTRDLPYAEGDIGPMYGWVWRHAGAKYTDHDDDYRGKGRDQLSKVIDLLRTDPYSRRIMMTTYDVTNVDNGCLEPCHGICTQFFVRKDDDGKKWLSASMLMRSCDVALGLPYNIASYATLVYIMAKIVDMHPDELIINMNDTHVYLNHETPIKSHMYRTPYPFPKLVVSDDVKMKSFEEMSPDDFDLVGYMYHPQVKMQMNV